MTIAQNNAAILGQERISKLLRLYAIPSIISMLVNALYNIVDQIFIGWGVGYLGNGATNIIFPITIVFAAFALMYGDGASAYLSLMLGANRKEEASRGIVNGIFLSTVTAVILSIVALLFFPQLLHLFGCTPELEPYARDYGYIIILGLPFQMICATINSVIRADGSPRYAMVAMLSGAVLNVILDPIFIFVFDLGVQGAAIATVISQIVSFILNIWYLRKPKCIELKGKVKFNAAISAKVVSLGISSFITQLFAALVMGLQNNLLRKYGALSPFGAEIPITVVGIVAKVNEILNSVLLGMAVGAQPIIGYNYGAQKYDRAKKALKMVIACGLIISTAAFILFQSVPDKIILLFGDTNDPQYIEFAMIAFRVYTFCIIANSVQMPIGIFWQAIGKGGKSALLSLSKQAIFVVPGLIFLGQAMGVTGVLAARPVADGLAFIMAILLLISEIRTFGQAKISKKAAVAHSRTIQNHPPQIIITISREYGSGGRYIGRLVAEQLGLPFYDKELIARMADETGLSESFIENAEQRYSRLSGFHPGPYTGPSGEDELFIKQSQVIQEIAAQGSCVIVGRCADYVLEDDPRLMKVFIFAGLQDKLARAVKYYHLDRDKAEQKIIQINRERANHYRHYTGRSWALPSSYDICLNSGLLGAENTAKQICDIVNQWLEQHATEGSAKNTAKGRSTI